MSTSGAKSSPKCTAEAAIKAGNIKQALVAIENLQPTDNINAVSAQLILFPNISLWLAFLNNQAIANVISEKHLREMYRTLTTQSEMSTSSPLAIEALKRLNVIKTRLFERAGCDEKQFAKACHWEDVHTQVGIMGRINEASADSKIFSMLLKSTNSALWRAFIGNRSVTTRLTKEQRNQLIKHLQKFASAPPDERGWTELLATYAIKLFPANYMEKISLTDPQEHSQRFELLLDFAITKINEHVKKKDNIETIRWLQFVLKLAEHAPTLGLLRANVDFKDKPPFELAILSSSLTVQLLNIFPVYVSDVLKNVYRCVQTNAKQKSHREYREAVSLVRSLGNTAAFEAIVKADPTCRELLSISLITDIAPPIQIPAAPAVVKSTSDDDNDDSEMVDVELGEREPLLSAIRRGPPSSISLEPTTPPEVGCLGRLFAPCLNLFNLSNKRRASPANNSEVRIESLTSNITIR